MKKTIILFTLLFLNSIICFAEVSKPSFQHLNLFTLDAINIINDYQNRLSEQEIVKDRFLWTKKDAKALYDFLNLNEEGVGAAYFMTFSEYIRFVGECLGLEDVTKSHDGQCGWALICRFATIKRIADGLTLEQIKSMSYPEIESEVDSLFYIVKNESFERALTITAQSFSNCVANNQ